MLNSNKMKGRIKELGMSQADCAQKMGMATPTFCQKLNNIRPMDLVEARKLSEVLNISEQDFFVYFFYDENCVAQEFA